MALKDQLLALCDEHDLTYLGISVYTHSDGSGRFLGMSVHAGDFAGSNKYNEQSIADGIATAIADLNGKRLGTPVVAELEGL